MALSSFDLEPSYMLLSDSTVLIPPEFWYVLCLNFNKIYINFKKLNLTLFFFFFFFFL
jgi:hypothetical protein